VLDQLQDDELVKDDLACQGRLENERGPWESTWRTIDDLYPRGAGGFSPMAPGAIRGEQLFDVTHISSSARFAAAGVAITTPQEKQYITPVFGDADLMKQRSVQLWCEEAGERLYNIRYAAHTGFTTAAYEDWDQLGRYGTSPMWCDAMHGKGMFYRTLHLSENYIDVDFAGMVNRNHRKFVRTADQCAQFFTEANITPKMADALARNKGSTEFELLHVVAPNTDWDEDKFDWHRFPVTDRYLAISEKIYLARGGYHTMPVSVSRHTTSPGEKYGRSPAINTLPTVNGLQAMRHTILRQAHKAVDPALAFYDDDGITSIATRPGGLSRGLVDEQGRILVARMPGGEQGLPFAENEANQEREVVKTEFLEEFYKILTDPNSRMTTTEVLEVMAKQGVLVRPYASRYETEKQNPTTQRELELAIRAKQLPPFPAVVVEAGAWPTIEYENMLAKMARAENTSSTMRFLEAITPMAQIDGGAVYDYVDTDVMVPGLAAEIGVKPSYIRDPNEVAAIRKQRQDQQNAAAQAEQAQQAAMAYQSLAKGNQLNNQGGGGAV
jgi:Bacteriophage head to tail connecting protein